MIKNDALANRLNAVKDGVPIPEREIREAVLNKITNHPLDALDGQNIQENPIDIKVTNFKNNVELILTLIGLSIYSLSFGYGLKTVFDTTWNFLGVTTVGIASFYLISNIYEFFKKD